MKISKNKNGSVLLLSLLVTSALLASILYINTISLRQNIQVTNIDNSLHSYHGAESGNEEALYRLRSGDYSDLASLNRSFAIGNTWVTRTVSDSLDVLVTGIKKDEFFAFDIFDPDNIEQGSDLSYLSLSWDDNCNNKSWIELTSNEWAMSGEYISWGSLENWNNPNFKHIKKSLLNKFPDQDEDPLNHIESVGGSVFDQKKAYQFRIKALYCDISNLTIRAFQQSSDPNGSGEPIQFKNVYQITSVAEYPKNSPRANKQALSVNFKRFAPLSGLFDYVIFSEESLIKDIESANQGANTTQVYISIPESLLIPIGVPYNYTITIVNATSPICKIDGKIPSSFVANNCSFSLKEEQPGQYLINIQATNGEVPIGSKEVLLIIQ